MPVIGDEYYRCQSCGGGWFVEQRRFRIRKDRDMEFFSEEEAYTTPAPTAQAQVDYVCADCGEPLVRNGLRRFVRRPPVVAANLRDELAALKEELERLKAVQAPAVSDGGKEVEHVGVISDGAHGDEEPQTGAPAGEGGQPGGDPAADGDGSKTKQGRKRSK